MRLGLSLRAVIRPAIFSVFVLLGVTACGDDALAPPARSVVTAALTHSRTGHKQRCTGHEFAGSHDSEGASGSVPGDVGVAGIEVFEFGDYALYVPACVESSGALLVALGGPDTRAFVTGKAFGAPIPEVEASFQVLGRELRKLAVTQGLAVFGRRGVLANGPDGDRLLLDAVRTGAELSGHPELPSAPLVVYGLSGGAPEASGFTARNPARVAGLFLKVPPRVESLTSGDAQQVPTYVVLAELDVFVNNAALTAAFEANRRAGALWALAMERAVTHFSLSPVQRQVTVTWIHTILKHRLPATPSDPLREIAESSGWLGDRASGLAWRWAGYPGDRALASWLPSRATAKQWEDLIAVR